MRRPDEDNPLARLAGDKSPFTASDYDYYARFLKEPGRTTAWMSVASSVDRSARQVAVVVRQLPSGDDIR